MAVGRKDGRRTGRRRASPDDFTRYEFFSSIPAIRERDSVAMDRPRSCTRGARAHTYVTRMPESFQHRKFRVSCALGNRYYVCAACGYVKPSASPLAGAVSARRVTSANTGPRTPKDARSLSPEQYDRTGNVDLNVFAEYVCHSRWLYSQPS